jgi:hypothetical protein
MIGTFWLMCAMPSVALPSEEVDLVRKFKQGETHQYEFYSKVVHERREAILVTFVPFVSEVRYEFTLVTEKEKPEGTADLRFRRGPINLRIAATFDEPAKTQKISDERNILFTLSPKNRVLAIKDETPKKPPSKPPKPLLAFPSPLQLDIGGWTSQMVRLSAFVGFLDFGPQLPLKKVKVGDSWFETVGDTPVTVSEGPNKDKMIVGRLDYKYVYKGETTVDGRRMVWIQGTLEQDTDAGKFLADILEIDVEQSPIPKVPLKMKATVNYYLEPDSLLLYKAEAEFEGYAAVYLKQFDDERAYEEDRFTSKATLVRKARNP